MLAKISGTPGKTRLINHFIINESWYLVDLPGYGFARIPKSERNRIEKLIQNYFLNRSNLLMTFILIDSRLEPQKIDLEFIRWFGTQKLSFVIVFTKTDKISKLQLKSSIQQYKQALSSEWVELPVLILTSSKTGEGKTEILNLIGELIGQQDSRLV